ncbi:YebC/PmpR family DNA-binding transcriptional regulator, partial [Patescibacteria group bacterium]|nr:YebC/PmpR family DNA-binding transcriptional regulator [Patescibacteria group bacterium]
IKKATEKNNKELLEEIRYEAYGPGGAALLINCVTDSKNRTTAEIKHILSQYDGKLATPGSVEWLFEKKGALTVKTNNANETDALELKLIDLGAEETERNEYDVTAYVSPAKISAFRDAVENGNIAVAEEYIAFLPKNPTDASDEETKQKIVELLETLNDHEDVQEAYSNVEFRN